MQALEHIEPSVVPPVDDSLPYHDSLTLEWVHGYRSEDCKSNVRYTATGEMRKKKMTNKVLPTKKVRLRTKITIMVHSHECMLL